MPAGEFGHMPVQMLPAEFVISPFVRSLEHRPKGLNPVRMDHASDIHTRRVLY